MIVGIFTAVVAAAMTAAVLLLLDYAAGDGFLVRRWK